MRSQEEATKLATAAGRMTSLTVRALEAQVEHG